MSVFIRSRLVDDEENGFSDPWLVPFIRQDQPPREGEQFLVGGRAFLVTLVEYHYKSLGCLQGNEDLHLFCIEYPKEAGPGLPAVVRDALRQDRDVFPNTPNRQGVLPISEEDSKLSEPTRERLGQMVRAIWVAWCNEQPLPKPSRLIAWGEMPETDREVDRRIGETLYLAGWNTALERVEMKMEATRAERVQEILDVIDK